jgi:hypothetical protein
MGLQPWLDAGLSLYYHWIYPNNIQPFLINYGNSAFIIKDTCYDVDYKFSKIYKILVAISLSSLLILFI